MRKDSTNGVGAGFHRTYRLVVNTSMTATEAMAALQADPNLMTEQHFAPFARLAGEMSVGRRGGSRTDDRVVGAQR